MTASQNWPTGGQCFSSKVSTMLTGQLLKSLYIYLTVCTPQAILAACTSLGWPQTWQQVADLCNSIIYLKISLLSESMESLPVCTCRSAKQRAARDKPTAHLGDSSVCIELPHYCCQHHDIRGRITSRILGLFL